jgi:predicted lipid-binding transport protein (Tim44 family)
VSSSKLLTLVLSCALALVAQDALAKRLGGGESLEKSAPDLSQHSDSAPMSAQAAPNSAAGAGATGALAVAPKSAWGAVIGGAAAGLGLVWLASSMGFGEEFAQLLLMGLVVLAILAALVLLRRSRPATSTGLVYQATGSGSGSSELDPVTPRGYSPKNVGNDASARPWEQHPIAAEPGEAAGCGIPECFDTPGFLAASKANFVSLQAAWDRSDIAALRAMMTDGMLEQIKVQLAEREQTQGEAPNQTDVVMLEARLLGIEELGSGYLASVEFSGLIREDASAGPNPFREVWNITRAKLGSAGWLVAGVQALQ